MLFAVKSAHC